MPFSCKFCTGIEASEGISADWSKNDPQPDIEPDIPFQTTKHMQGGTYFVYSQGRNFSIVSLAVYRQIFGERKKHQTHVGI